MRFLQLIPCAALLYSSEGEALAANELFCKLTGYQQHQLPGLTIDSLASWHRCEIELRPPALDGPGHYLALLRHHDAQGPNCASGDGLRGGGELILHAIDEAFVLLDQDFRIQLINDEALRIDGRPRTALTGKTLWEAWPGSESMPLGDACRKAMRERVPISSEQAYLYQGNELWIEARALPFEDGLAVLYRNITERKQAERAIRDSEAKFRTIADAVPQIVWSTLPDGYHDYFNHQWYEYTGMPEHAAQGDAWMGIFHPDDQPIMLARWNHSLVTGERYEAQFRLRHRSGEYRWTLGRALPVRNEKGKIIRWMGTSTDIHEHITTQAKLNDIQARLEAALAAAQIGTWTWDVRADVAHGDRHLGAMLGLPHFVEDGGSLEDFYAIVHPDDVDGVRAAVAHSLATGELYHEDFRVRDPSGGVRFMQTRGTVVNGADGRPVRMSGAVVDVTRQQLAEEALKASELTFRTLADNIPQLAWMADRDGHIYWYNNRWFSYTGTTLDEMKGWGWEKVHHPDHVARVVALYRQQIVERQLVWEDTFPLRGADGNYRWFLSRAVPIRDKEGRVVRWLGTNTDVTLQREAEQALQQANQRKDDFLALLAHELRNPLAPISTAAQLLRMGEHNPEYIRRSSEIIDRQVKHMSDMVNDLMDVSRVTRGLASIEKEAVSVEAVVRSAVEQSRPLIEARKQDLVVQIGDNADGVLGDETRLVQVLTNLLNNASKYTQQGGRIVLGANLRGECVEIHVADNGMGMDAALLPHVFELFTQAARTPDRGEGGLGIGLALVKSIVTLHNGRITATSPGPGLGSTFTVSLPSLTPHAGQAERQSLHILLVDRMNAGDAGLPATLQAEGHTVALCPDEQCALDSARKLHPDAVLIRTDLPGVEGYALARQLRALHPDEHPTFIALSDPGQSHDKIIARGAGFDHLLESPVAMGSLRRILPLAPD